MAQKRTTTKNLNSHVAQSWRRHSISISPATVTITHRRSDGDLEAQISHAANELARESANDKPADPPGARPRDRKAMRLKWRPPEIATQNSRPQNDGSPSNGNKAPPDGGRSPATPPAAAGGFRRPTTIDRKRTQDSGHPQSPASNGIYWVVLLLSIAWLSGGVVLGRVLLGPDIWKIRTVESLLARPYLIVLGIAIVVPVILFWGFAVIIGAPRTCGLPPSR